VRRATCIIFLMLNLVVGVQAHSQTAVATPTVEQREPQKVLKTKWFYRFFRKFVVDVDGELRKKNIEIVSCSFISAKKQETFSYPGIGPCLFSSFRESMSKKNGVIYAWGKTPWGDLRPLRIEWHPTAKSWWHIYQIYREFANEDKAVAKKSTSGSSVNSIVGEIKMFFSSDFPVQRLAIVTNPARRIDGIIENQGTLQIILNRSLLQNKPLNFEWSTNINPTKLDRGFYFSTDGMPLVEEASK
jgi:hypothetical protein